MASPLAHPGPADPSSARDARQRERLGALLAELRATNAFYRRKLEGVWFDPLRDDLAALPFTTRQEIEQDQLAHPPYGTNLTYPLDHYSRFHQTSGTGGRPVRWLDTPASWEWVKSCWRAVFAAAGVRPGDRLLFPFSFGPFLGFWSAFESATAMGLFCVPAGGMSTTARLRMILDNEVTVVLCTPTYALRLADAAAEEGIDLAGSRVRALIVAGEPGGSVPATRHRIESAWGARVFDHGGMTETGPVSFECEPAPGGLHVNEDEYLVESIDPATAAPVADDEMGELVLTNLGRTGSPLIRYRTGDLVRLSRGRLCACGSRSAKIVGGILGRRDDMFIVRGNNVFPSALEAVLRQFPQIAEYRVHISDAGAMSEVRIEVEPQGGAAAIDLLLERVGGAIQSALCFRVEIRSVPPGTLPRFEMKARRFVRG